jgi:hypothetical protein
MGTKVHTSINEILIDVSAEERAIPVENIK